ncbi:MAG: hypothetical protein ACFFDH_12880 [Promethearchaeota archaeon]
MEQVIKDAISVKGHGGGFLIFPANFHPTISAKWLKWMINARNRFGEYSLKSF